MSAELSMLAGAASSVLFALGVVPMLTKAVRTRDLSSYSLGNIVLANVGNLIHTMYVVSLPFGPVWFLHGFYLVTTAFMLAMYLADRRRHAHNDPFGEVSSSTEATAT